MRIEITILNHMFLFIPTIGMDTEYKFIFIIWLNRAIFLGKGKEKKL